MYGSFLVHLNLIFFSFFKIYLLGLNILPACMDVHYMPAVPKEARRGRWIPGTADGCEPPTWELNLIPLGEQQVLLPAEPSPQPL